MNQEIGSNLGPVAVQLDEDVRGDMLEPLVGGVRSIYSSVLTSQSSGKSTRFKRSRR